MTSQIKNMKNAIFNLHVPPFGSGLDTAPRLMDDLQIKGGETKSVGSTAVMESIQIHQPLLGLHGHIHEVVGKRQIGRTLCINPGSNYTEGILNGVLVALDQEKIRSMVSQQARLSFCESK